MVTGTRACRLAAALAVTAAAEMVGPASAQNAGGVPGLRPTAAQAAAPVPTRWLRVFNDSRRQLLSNLTVLQGTASVDLRGVIRPGKWRVLALPAFKGCQAQYHVTFSATPPLTRPVDLCRQTSLRLVPQ